MRYLDVCSGISAPTMAWKPLGWQALCFAEIEAAPRAVLAHHYPDTPLNGDFTQIKGDEYGPVDLLVGGTPCQSFSVAGLRKGLADERGNLALEYLRLADRSRARWLVWENVPGVLSSSGGRDFGAFLGGLVQLGYGFAYRVLDAQHFGVPQRRRRVFVVGHLGDWRRAAAVLFERHSLSGDSPPRREAGEGAAGRVARSVAIRGRDGTPQAELGDEVANAILTPNGGRAGVGCGAALIGGWDYENNAHGADEPTGPLLKGSPTGGGRPLPAIAYQTSGNCGAWETGAITGALDTNTDPNSHVIALQERTVCENPSAGPDGAGFRTDGKAYTLEARTVPQAVAFAQNSRDELREMPYAGALSAEPGMKQTTYVRQSSAVRRLTPRECERLQGFPDDFTLVPYRKGMMADGPRYKMLGNSMAVPVVRWIGDRIALVDAIASESIAA